MLEAAVVAAALAFAQGNPVVDQARETAYARIPLADKIAGDPEAVKAIAARNRVIESPGDIRRKDADWQRNRNYPLRKTLTSGPCANRLRKLIQDDALVVEAFLMDSRGSLVCASVETTDYWQGDEAKWQRTYQEGKETFVDEPAFDASTGTYAIQVSVPVYDPPGQRIGALTLTLKLRR
jgi:hypothetical protein